MEIDAGKRCNADKWEKERLLFNKWKTKYLCGEKWGLYLTKYTKQFQMG